MEFVILWVLCALVGYFIGKSRGRQDTGCALGCLLGPFGWIIAAFLTPAGTICPYCRERVHPEATICPHCQGAIGPPDGEPRPKPKSVGTWDPSAAEGTCPGCGAKFRGGITRCSDCDIEVELNRKER